MQPLRNLSIQREDTIDDEIKPDTMAMNRSSSHLLSSGTTDTTDGTATANTNKHGLKQLIHIKNEPNGDETTVNNINNLNIAIEHDRDNTATPEESLNTAVTDDTNVYVDTSNNSPNTHNTQDTSKDSNNTKHSYDANNPYDDPNDPNYGKEGPIPKNWPVFRPLEGPYPWWVYKKDYIQIKNEILVGIVVGCAQVPESVAFAFLAGVDPGVGLHAAWIIGFIVSLTGNRPGLISGATGAMAAILMDPIRQYGISYLFYTVILKGIIQTVVSFMGFERIANLVPYTTNIGFVNGLAIIIGLSQINNFEVPDSDNSDNKYVTGSTLGAMIILSLITFAIIELFPRLTKVVPSSLVGITVCTMIEHFILRPSNIAETTLIGDISSLSGAFPNLIFFDNKYSNDLPSLLEFKTWEIITPPAILTALVGMIECVMTIEVIDDLSDTPHLPVTQQLASAGVANFISGFFGTMGGGATIGLSMICIHSGANGRYRISGVVAAIFLLIIILAASPVLEIVPTSALIGVMLVVVIHTFEWNSLLIVFISVLPMKARDYLSNQISRFRYIQDFQTKRKIGRSDAFVIVAVTVLTLIFDLAISVIFGVLFSATWYVWQQSKQCKVTSQLIQNNKNMNYNGSKISKTSKTGKDSEDSKDSEVSSNDNAIKVYFIDGPLFFGNSHWIRKQFDFNNDPNSIEIHLTDAYIYDYSAMQSLNFIGEKYKKLGKNLVVKNVNRYSHRIIKKAKDLLIHFEYEAIVTVEEKSNLELTAPDRLHVSRNDKA